MKTYTHDIRPWVAESPFRGQVVVPEGPWDDEPDKAQWVDETTNLDCLIVRNPLGALCGYVGVTKDHPAYGKEYSEVEVSVHGDLTFAAKCQEGTKDEAHGICHVPEPGRSHDIWWLGFDCGHHMDYSPGLNFPGMSKVGVYRTFEYVQEECAQLAAQLFEQS